MNKLLSYFIEQEETKEFEHCSGDTYYILPTKHEHVYFTLNFDEDMQLVFHCYNKDTNITFEEFKALEFLIDKGWK